MKGWRGGRFAIFCWKEGFSLYKVVASSLLPSLLPSLWFSVSRTMVKALEILKMPSAPSAPETPPLRFSLLLLWALALKKLALSSHHLQTDDKKIAMNLHNKTMAWTQLNWTVEAAHLGWSSPESCPLLSTSSFLAWTCPSLSWHKLRYPHQNLCSVASEESLWGIQDQAQTFGRVQDLLRCLCSLLLERVLQAVLH